MEQLVNFIIRPPRAEYNPEHDLLEKEFMLRGKWYQRKDLEVKNSRGDVLQCSHYMPLERPDGKALPCVIYCHGNSGCRADASEAAIILLPSNITVFTLDFSGSGLSGGEHVTLGWNERDDLSAVVKHLRAEGNVSLIGLWGRSMGAVTSLMYGAEDPSIAGMVLDSPFSDLVDLMMELVDTYKFRLPKFTVKFAIQYMRRAIQKKAKFDIMDLNTMKVAKSCFVPVLFGHAIDDDFIRPHHSERIHEVYVGDKNIIKFEGDHNSPRPQFYFDSINIFFHNVLQPPDVEVGPTFYDPMDDYFGKGSWSTMNAVGFLPQSSTAHTRAGLDGSSISDAINQVRIRRPMSRTEVPSDGSAESRHLEAKDKDNDDGASSDMISFELSNGHPYSPRLSTALDDDQYLEYQLDDLADFPTNAEEEERMLMEAVLESLKDMEMQRPKTEEKPDIGTDLPRSGQKDPDATPSSSEHSGPARTSTSSRSESSTKLEADSFSTSAVSSQNIPPSNADSVSSKGGPPDIRPTVPEAVRTERAGHASSSGTTPNPSDPSDMSANTKATVTVERSQSGKVLDGLIRRWDLNFFRSR